MQLKVIIAHGLPVAAAVAMVAASGWPERSAPVARGESSAAVGAAAVDQERRTAHHLDGFSRPVDGQLFGMAIPGKPVAPSWRFVSSGTTSTLFGVDVVNRNVVWAAGQDPGVVLRTVDGGRSWHDITPPGAATLLFHDVEAFDRNHAVVLAVGAGKNSKIFRTANGGASWQLAFENQDKDAFYDCLAFFSPSRGLAVSDPVDGAFRILGTNDGGRSWRVISEPAAMTGEFAHATGTCLITVGPHNAWLGTATAAGTYARVLRTRDGGRTWAAVTTPIRSSEKFGIVSLSFRDREHGLALGAGDLDSNTPSVVAYTADGGKTWTRVGSPAGFRISIAWLPTNTKQTAVVVGRFGSDLSTDAGRTWRLFSDADLRRVDCMPHLTCWAAGVNGVAAELSLTPP